MLISYIYFSRENSCSRLYNIIERRDSFVDAISRAIAVLQTLKTVEKLGRSIVAISMQYL